MKYLQVISEKDVDKFMKHVKDFFRKMEEND